jgi:putative DNA double-strand break repair rad50 ATPase (fragment)
MELVIKSITPAVVQMNIDEVEKYMAEVKEKYQNIVFTADEIKTATEERTKLNKLEKNISDVRKKIEKDGMADIKSIIDTLKTAEKDTKALSNNIGEQIKRFEEEEWQKKLEEIGEIKNKIFRENKLLERYFVIRDKWKNKTMTIKKIEEEIKEQFEYWNKRYNFITSQLIAVNEEIENKLKFEDVQYLMLEEYDNIMKKLVDKKNEIKTTEENIKRKAEEDKQKALAELEAKKEQEKQEAVQQTQKNYVASDPKTTENEKYFDTTIRFENAPLSFLKELKALSDKYEIKYQLLENIEL